MAWVAFGAWLIGPWIGIPLAVLVLIGVDFAVATWRERGEEE